MKENQVQGISPFFPFNPDRLWTEADQNDEAKKA